MGSCPQVFDAVVQLIAIDVINKLRWLVAVHHPNQTMNGVELVVDFDATVSITIDGSGDHPNAATIAADFPEQLAIPVLKKFVQQICGEFVGLHNQHAISTQGTQ